MRKVIVDKDSFEKEIDIILDDLACPEYGEKEYLKNGIMTAFNFYSEDINE